MEIRYSNLDGSHTALCNVIIIRQGKRMPSNFELKFGISILGPIKIEMCISTFFDVKVNISQKLAPKSVQFKVSSTVQYLKGSTYL